jgi:hypothetical protein
VGQPYKLFVSPTSKRKKKIPQVMKSAFCKSELLLSTSHSFAMATVDLSHVQFWHPPLNPLPPKHTASLRIRKNGRSGWTTSSRNQPASLDNKADEILRRDNQPKSAVAAAQHQGRDFAFQQEDDAVGSQGTMKEDPRDEPG